MEDYNEPYDFEGTGECHGCMAMGPSSCPTHGDEEQSDD